MTERPNIFVDAENVGQLFDALWFSATLAAEARVKHKASGAVADPDAFFRKAREIAVADAHRRYQELTS